MFKRALAALLPVVLIVTLTSIPVFAAAPADENRAPDPPSPAKRSDESNRKLKADISKLTADARAGKVAPRAQQFPNTKRNNLSTGAKIGIVAGIGAAIFLIIMFHAINSDDD